MYKDELIPKGTKIVGYARSELTVDKLRSKAEPYMKVRVDAAVCQKYLESISLNERYQWLTIFPISDKIDPFGISCKNKGQREGLGDKFAFFFHKENENLSRPP